MYYTLPDGIPPSGIRGLVMQTKFLRVVELTLKECNDNSKLAITVSATTE